MLEAGEIYTKGIKHPGGKEKYCSIKLLFLFIIILIQQLVKFIIKQEDNYGK